MQNEKSLKRLELSTCLTKEQSPRVNNGFAGIFDLDVVDLVVSGSANPPLSV